MLILFMIENIKTIYYKKIVNNLIQILDVYNGY